MKSDTTNMIYKEFIIQFQKQVFALDYNRQISLAIEVCQKLYFDYVIFSEKFQWGDKNVLLDAIKIIEESVTIDIEHDIIEGFLKQLDFITPDMEDFGSDEVASYALNACVAVYYSLEFLLNKNPINIFYIGTSVTDSIDIRIQQQATLTEQEIDNNALMQEAREFLIERSK